MQHNDQKIGVVSTEERNIHWQLQLIGLVERHAEVPLAGELQQGECAQIHETHFCRVLSSFQHEVANWHQDIGNVTVLQDIGHKLGDFLQALPQQNQQLLLDAD